MPVFKIPVWWMTSGMIKVEAESLDEALIIAAEEGSPVVVIDDCYVEGSWNVDIEAAKDLASDMKPQSEDLLD